MCTGSQLRPKNRASEEEWFGAQVCSLLCTIVLFFVSSIDQPSTFCFLRPVAFFLPATLEFTQGGCFVATVGVREEGGGEGAALFCRVQGDGGSTKRGTFCRPRRAAELRYFRVTTITHPPGGGLLNLP